MASKKLTTNLAGLKVAKFPHHMLTVLYGKINRCLAKMPTDAAYRQYTEQIINERLAVVNTEADITKLEEKIGAGQVEEVISSAENELNLARKMLEWRAWEPLNTEAPPNQWKWPIAN